MRRIFLIGMVVVFMAVGLACGKSVHRSTAEQWLNSLDSGSRHNVAGAWRGPQQQGYSPWTGFYDATFGPIVLVQEGSKLTGNYNEYEVIGRISEDKVFLVAVHGDVVYHTWHFRFVPEAKSLVGRMCDGYFPQEEPHCYPLTLGKMSS